MSRRLFDYDPDSLTTTWFEDTDDGFRLITTQDAEPVLEANKALRGGSGREHWKGDFRLEATVPFTVLLKWAEEDGVPPGMVFSDEYARRIVRRLNDSDFRNFKTADVRI